MRFHKAILTAAAAAALLAAAPVSAQIDDALCEVDPSQCPPPPPPPEEPPPSEPPPSDPPPEPQPGEPELCPIEVSQGLGVFVGMVSDQLFANPDPQYRRCALNRHADAGVRIIRQAMYWKTIELVRGQYDWAHWDQYVEDVARHGIQVMPIIFDAPVWHQQRRTRTSSWASMPPRPAAMASFAGRLVRRYGPEGSFWEERPELPPMPIRHWQIWNEPNLPRYWAERPSAAEYVKLLRASYRRIKREDPGAQVVAAGMPDSRLFRVIPLYAYITQMYEAGARGTFDAIAVNAYAEKPGMMIKNLGKVRAIMRFFRDHSNIWITEMGWGTGGPKYRFRVNRTQQAKLIGQALGKLRKNRRKLGLKGFVHYMWQDAPPYGTTPDFWGLHTGLLDITGDEKPAYAVFRKHAHDLRWLP